MAEWNEDETLLDQLANHAKTRGDRPAVFGKSGARWVGTSWKDYWATAREVGKALISLGHEPGECVAIVGDNRPEWVFAEFGIMAAAGIVAPIYQTSTEEQVAYILGHSKARIAICDQRAQLEKFMAAAASSPDTVALERFILMDDDPIDDERVLNFKDLLQMGRAVDDSAVDARIESVKADSVALLIYTSGTTGVPKAVQLDHGNMTSVAYGALEFYREIDDDNYRAISYLPLSHVAEQMFTTMVHIRSGGEVYFCAELKKVRDYLPEVQPTSFVGVPRVWEKFEAAMKARLAEATGFRKRLVEWARAQEFAAFEHKVRTGQDKQGFMLNLARKLVISKVKERLGLQNLVLAATGAAPISVGTLEFMASLGIVIHEGFGMSETSGAITGSPLYRPRVGWVGRALPGVQIKIADDGEICLKGRPMTRGYLGMPDKTAELIDEQGWLHTGDLGKYEDGWLAITGRKKDILITAGGKNVAPAKIEGKLSQLPGIGQAVVVGDRERFLAALLVIDPEALPELRDRLGLGSGATVADVAASDKFDALLREGVDKDVNPELARYEQIKKFTVLPNEFSVDTGELTPTMKVKRNVVNEKFAAQIKAMFA